LTGAPAPARNFFSSPSLNSIYSFSLNSKTTEIYVILNFIFLFPPLTIISNPHLGVFGIEIAVVIVVLKKLFYKKYF